MKHQALILAAGKGSRTHLDYSKSVYEINNQPLFMYSVKTFLEIMIPVVLVVSADDFEYASRYTSPKIKVVVGGETRSDSVRLGLQHIESEYVLIHDAARPYLSVNLVMKIQEELETHDTVLLASRIVDSLKKIEGDQTKSVDRHEYIAAETPQSFKTREIVEAYRKIKGNFSDDISVYEKHFNKSYRILLHETRNDKITYFSDIRFLEAMKGYINMRMGHSFDIHELVEGRPLIIGGIMIPFAKGLKGHSDADVLLHVIAESIYGALALGDLGFHFPDSDPATENISSIEILKDALFKMNNLGYTIRNIDSTIYAEAPKMQQYIFQMKKHLVKLLNVHSGQLNIKASTYEKMDSIGEGKAIAAEAVVLLAKV